MEHFLEALKQVDFTEPEPVKYYCYFDQDNRVTGFSNEPRDYRCIEVSKDDIYKINYRVKGQELVPPDRIPPKRFHEVTDSNQAEYIVWSEFPWYFGYGTANRDLKLARK